VRSPDGASALDVDHSTASVVFPPRSVFGVDVWGVRSLPGLPFHVWVLALPIGRGALIVITTGRPDDVGTTTAVTVAVMLMVADLSPHAAWPQPILRVLDTASVVAIGLGASWLGVPRTTRRTGCRLDLRGRAWQGARVSGCGSSRTT